MTRLKKQSPDAGVTLDLSWTHSCSVNTQNPRDIYCEVSYKLLLPTAGDAVSLIRKHSQGRYLYSIDLAVGPTSNSGLTHRTWPCLAYDGMISTMSTNPYLSEFDGKTWIDKECPVALPSFSRRRIMVFSHIVIIFIGVEPRLSESTTPFHWGRSLLSELGVEVSIFKAILPPLASHGSVLNWTCNVVMEICMPQAKIDDTLALLQELVAAPNQGHTTTTVILCKLLHREAVSQWPSVQTSQIFCVTHALKSSFCSTDWHHPAVRLLMWPGS